MQELPVILIAGGRRLEISFGSRGHFVTSNRAGEERNSRGTLSPDCEHELEELGENEEVEKRTRERELVKIKEPSASARERWKRLRRTSGCNYANIYMR